MNAKPTTKTDLIAVLVAAGGYGTARSLRDKRHADLTAMVTIHEQVAAEQAAIAASEAVDAPVEEPKAKAPRSTVAADATDRIVKSQHYSQAEVAAIVGLSKAAVRRWTRLGMLATVTVDGASERSHYVLGSDLLAFLASTGRA